MALSISTGVCLANPSRYGCGIFHANKSLKGLYVNNISLFIVLRNNYFDVFLWYKEIPSEDQNNFCHKQGKTEDQNNSLETKPLPRF